MIPVEADKVGPGILDAVLTPRAPDPAERRIVEACLLALPAAQEAWRRFLAEPGVPASCRMLLPLLGARLDELSPSPPQALATRLRAATLVERQRHQAASEILAGLKRVLDALGTDWLLVGGPSLARFYPDHRLRHTSRLDFLLPSAAAAQEVAARLLARGFTQTAPRRGSLALRHGSGMGVLLRTVSAWPLTEAEAAILRREAVTAGDHGLACRVPATEHALLLLALDAPRAAARGDLRWLVDACYLLRTGRLSTDRLAELGHGAARRTALAGLLRRARGIDGTLGAELGAMPGLRSPPGAELLRAVLLHGRRHAAAAAARSLPHPVLQVARRALATPDRRPADPE